ncbi:MAG TPA: cupin domain-containing protein [Vicinamibacterales bacterium]|jgi:quercetin dioxygenase-like cupin family protein|nr:cupin domain-containing protein [Vicinamibacterales bacterium]
MSAMTTTHRRWNDVPAEQINPEISRRFITCDRVTVARFELTRGGVVPEHRHDNEQVSMVMSGALKFKVGGQETVVRGGEVIHLPGGVPHEVEVLEDSVVVDVFSPVRQDWVDGTDTYFRR